MTIRAWYMYSDESVDQRELHQQSPNVEVPPEILKGLGLLTWTDIAGETCPLLQQIREERGYNFQDIIRISPETLPNYDDKLKTFYREHIHYDEEIRLCLEGTGYFDFRDEQDRWIRVAVEAGDLVIIPEGSYHRFTLDTNNYLKAMRLFCGEPVWTPYNRDEIEERTNASRLKYEVNFLAPLRENTPSV